MFSAIMQMFEDSFSSCVGWFEQLLESLGSEFGNLILCAFVIFTVYRFILVPIVGGSSVPDFSGFSDSVNGREVKKEYGTDNAKVQSKWDEAEREGLY